MIPRGSSFRVAGTILLLSASLMVSVASATTTQVVNTLNLSLPGPFNPCTVLDPNATATTSAILDLVRPSAFQTTPGDNLVGEGGAIASAELTSLNPETIVYTIAPNQHWSNGEVFDATTLINWWNLERQRASVQSDGYRDIGSLIAGNSELTLTATFAKPYAEWNLLFRDVEATQVPLGCTWADFNARPSLGPYSVTSASSHKFVLVSNPNWTLNPARFARVVITDSNAAPSNPIGDYVSYSLNVSRQALEAVSSRGNILSHIGTSSSLLELTFGPHRLLTKRSDVREGLSLILNRQEIIDNIFGSVTFSPSPAQSALYSQGQDAYPGGSGNGPSAQSTTTTITSTNQTNALVDCRACAIALFHKLKFHFVSSHWYTSTGQRLALRVIVGPSGLDHEVATQIEDQWAKDGIAAYVTYASSDAAASLAAADNSVDVAIFTRPTSTTAAYTARSFAGPAYLDSYPSGVRNNALNALYAKGIDIFNPVTAEATWLNLDQDIIYDFWVRPLFTAPSLVEWSNTVSSVYGGISVSGLVDEVPSWTEIPVNSQG